MDSQEPVINEPVEPPDEQSTGGSRHLPLVIGALAVAAVAAIALFVSGGDDGDSAAAGLGADGELDGLIFINEDGTEGTLADFEGEPLVVNFYASWCAPCRAELPDFDEVHVAADGRVQFLGVNHDIDDSSWKSFLEELPLTYPTVFQPEQELWESLNLFGMPATAFVTADGEVVHTFSGVLDQASLEGLIAEHLDVEV